MSERVVAEGNSSNVCESEEQDTVFLKLQLFQKLEFKVSSPQRAEDMTFYFFCPYLTHPHELFIHIFITWQHFYLVKKQTQKHKIGT